ATRGGEVMKGLGGNAEQLKYRPHEAFQPADAPVRESGAAMGSAEGGQGQYPAAHSQPGYHEARIQTAHAVGHQVDWLAGRRALDEVFELAGALGHAPRRA